MSCLSFHGSSAVNQHISVQGKCKIVKGSRCCRDCRLKKCLEMGFPAVGCLPQVYGIGSKESKPQKRESKGIQTDVFVLHIFFMNDYKITLSSNILYLAQAIL